MTPDFFLHHFRFYLAAEGPIAYARNRKWGHSGFRNPPQCYAVYWQYAITQMERVMIKVLTIKVLESQHSGR